MIASFIKKKLLGDDDKQVSGAASASNASASTSSGLATSAERAAATTSTPTVTATATATPTPTTPTPSPSFQRAAKELGLFFAGAAFFALSTAITRRAVARRQVAAQLQFYQPSGKPGGFSKGEGAEFDAATRGVGPFPRVRTRPKVEETNSTRPKAEETKKVEEVKTVETPENDSLVAFEALQLATLNVASFFLMMAGGVAWALDIASLSELQQRARDYVRASVPRGNGTSTAASEAEAEAELDEWVFKMLGRRLKGGEGGSKESKQGKEEKEEK